VKEELETKTGKTWRRRGQRRINTNRQTRTGRI